MKDGWWLLHSEDCRSRFMMEAKPEILRLSGYERYAWESCTCGLAKIKRRVELFSTLWLCLGLGILGFVVAMACR